MRSVVTLALTTLVLAVALNVAYAESEATENFEKLDLSIASEVDKISNSISSLFDQQSAGAEGTHSLSELNAEASVEGQLARRRWFRRRRHAPRRVHHRRRHVPRRRHHVRRHVHRRVHRPRRHHVRRHVHRRVHRPRRHVHRPRRHVHRRVHRPRRHVPRRHVHRRPVHRPRRVHRRVVHRRPAPKRRFNPQRHIPKHKRVHIPAKARAKLRQIHKYIKSHPKNSPVVKALKIKQKAMIKRAKQKAKVAKLKAKAVKKKMKAIKKHYKAQAKARKIQRKLKKKVMKAKAKAKVKKAKRGMGVDARLVKKYKDKIAEMFRVQAKIVETKDMPIDLAIGKKPWVPHFIGKKPDLRMPRDDASVDWKPHVPLFKNMSSGNHDASADKLILAAKKNREEVQEVMDLFPHPVWPPLQA